MSRSLACLAATEMGIGLAADPGNAVATYCAQVFGTPLP
jgi:hypothetical protein